MSKKKISIIIIGAVIMWFHYQMRLIMVREKKKSINLGKSSEETDEQSYWNPDIHPLPNQRMVIIISYDIDGTTLRYFDDTAKVYSCMCKA